MSLSLQEILTQALGFFILVFVLKKIFWKPFLASLDERRRKIEAAFLQIETSKKEIEELRLQYQSRIEKIEEEALAKMQAAVDEGKRVSREIQEKTREEAKEALTRTQENLALEVAKARIELRKEVANLTLLTTEKLLREKMTDSKQQEKILEMIESLEPKA